MGSHNLKISGIFALAIVLTVTLAACDMNGNDIPDPVAEYDVTIQVEELKDGDSAAVEGATVEFNNIGSKTTDGEGLVTFEEVEVDNYEYTVTKDNYDLVERDIYLDDDVIDEVTIFKQNTITNTEQKRTYDELPQALDGAEEGDTLIIGSGRYEEGHDDNYLSITTENITLQAAREHEAELFGILPGTYHAEGIAIKGLMINADGMRHGIDIHDDNTLVKNNIIKNADLGIYVGAVDDSIGPQEGVEIIDNVVKENNEAGVLIHAESSLDSISGNEIANNELAGIIVRQDSEADISNNEIKNNGDRGIVVAHGAYAEIENNFIQGYEHIGINIRNDSEATIKENEIKESNHGILIEPSFERVNDDEWEPIEGTGSEATIEGNKIENNNEFGIYCFESHIDVLDNIIVNNGIIGLGIYSHSKAYVADNIIREHTGEPGEGIAFQASEVDIVNNKFEENETGLAYSFPVDDYNYDISENNFEKNTFQVIYYTVEDEEWLPPLLEDIYEDNDFIPEKDTKENDIEEEYEGEHDYWYWKIVTNE